MRRADFRDVGAWESNACLSRDGFPFDGQKWLETAAPKPLVNLCVPAEDIPESQRQRLTRRDMEKWKKAEEEEAARWYR